MGCLTVLELSTTATRTLFFSGEAEAWEVVAGLLTWEDVDVGLVGRVGAATDNGPGKDGPVLGSPPEIPSVGVPLELTGTSLCTVEGVTLGAETGEEGNACGANTKSGGSAGRTGSHGGSTEETMAAASVEAGESMLEQHSLGKFIGAEAAEVPSLDDSLEPTGTSLCSVEGVNIGAKTGEGDLASGAKTSSGGSAGWADSGGVYTGSSGAETKAGASIESGEAML